MVILNILFLLLAIAMVAVILVQRGPGATAGAAFGSGASGTVFGARGSTSFLTRLTAVLAILFCSLSLVMAIMAARSVEAVKEPDLGVVDQITNTREAEPTVPDSSDVPVATDVETADEVEYDGAMEATDDDGDYGYGLEPGTEVPSPETDSAEAETGTAPQNAAAEAEESDIPQG